MPDALTTLIDLAKSRMDDAAKRLGELLSASTQHEEKLQLLVTYRDEYRARFRSAAQAGIGPDAWRNYSVFLGKLEEAIAEQEKVVAQARLQVSHGRQAWVDERNRKKAFDTLAERKHQVVLRQELRAEQRLTDEHSAKLFRPGDEDEGQSPHD